MSKDWEFHTPITGWQGHMYCAYCAELWPCKVVQARTARQPRERKPAPREDPPVSRRDLVILRARAALRVA